MAVTTEQIKARLKVKFPKANLSQKRIDALAAKLAPKPKDGATDEEIDSVLENANDFMSFEDIAKEDDRMRTLEANQKPKTEPAPTDPLTPKPTEPVITPPAGDVPEWAKALIKQNETVVAEITALKTGNVLATKKATAAELFGKSEVLKALKEEVRPNWINRINVDSETSIEDQIAALESEYTIIAQSNANSTPYSGPTPTGANPGTKVDEALVNSVVDSF